MRYYKTQDDFKKHLAAQIHFLEQSSKSYDDGFEDEAQRLATTLRVLFHNKKDSPSLLAHLKIEDNIHFISSVHPYIPANQATYLGFLTIRSTVGGSLYIPNCTIDDKSPNKWFSVNDWWNEIVLDDKTNVFSRRELVLKIANKDGGTHVDATLNDAYAGLVKNNSTGWMYEFENTSFPLDNNPAYACIRQIAYEVLLSLQLYIATKSFTRRKQKLIFKVAYINDNNLYIYEDDGTDPIKTKFFTDSRVKKIEDRILYVDEVRLKNTGTFTRATVI